MDDRHPFQILEAASIDRAEKALRIAWAYVEASIPTAEHARQRRRIQFVVASLALEGIDDPAELAHRAIRRFQEKQIRRS